MAIGNLLKIYEKYDPFDLSKRWTFDMLLKEANKVLTRYEKLKSKDETRRIARESRKKACESRLKLIPKNTTLLYRSSF
jgi:hypothetical protein